MIIGGCGCCSSPWVSFEKDGVMIVDDVGDFHINMFTDNSTQPKEVITNKETESKLLLMKWEKDLKDKLLQLEKELNETEIKYSKLCQIDMLSGEGAMLNEKIYLLKGKIEIIELILNNF